MRYGRAVGATAVCCRTVRGEASLANVICALPAGALMQSGFERQGESDQLKNAGVRITINDEADDIVDQQWSHNSRFVSGLWPAGDLC